MIQLTHFDSEDDYYIAQIGETSVTANSNSPIFRTTVCGPWSGRPLVQPVWLCDVKLLLSLWRQSINILRQHFGRIISDYNLFLPLPLFVSVTLVEKWASRFLFNLILLWNYRIYLQKTVRMYLMYINWNFSTITVLYGFSLVLYLMNAKVVTI